MESKEVRETKREAVDKVLRNLKSSTGAISAHLVSVDGFNMDGALEGSDFAAMLASKMAIAAVVLKILKQGILRKGTLETDESVLMIVPVGDKAWLALLLSNEAMNDDESLPNVALRNAAQEIAEIVK